MKIGLVAIFKNEYPYILEWIAYHKSIGVDNFYIADNVSDDGSSELLQSLEEIGVITRIPFPRIGDQGPQSPAYNHILKKYGNEVDIMGFIDADEFIVSDSPLKKNLEDFYKDDNYGAMGLNWSVYGSSDDYFSADGLVIERFTKHAPLEYNNNRHIKTLLKPSFVEKMHIHECVLNHGAYCTSLNEKMCFDQSGARTETTIHSKLRINHYVVKSRIEHFINKRKKGSAAGSASREKGIAYFIGHDKNSEKSEFSPVLVKDVKSIISDLKQQLLSRSSFMAIGKGRAKADITKHTISGWVVSDNEIPGYVNILIDDTEYKVAVNKNRKDVFKKGISSEPICGFDLTVDFEIKDKNIAVYIYGSIQSLPVNYV